MFGGLDLFVAVLCCSFACRWASVWVALVVFGLCCRLIHAGFMFGGCFVLVLVCLFGVALRLWCLIVLYLLFKWWFCFMFVWLVFVTLLFSVAVC